MKQIILLSIYCFLATHLNAQNSEYGSTANILKISPAQFGESYLEFSYEHALNDGNSSIQFSPMIMLKDNGYEKFKGVQFETQYRLYLKRLRKDNAGTWIFSDISFYTGAYTLGLIYNEEFRIDNYDYQTEQYYETINDRDITAGEGGVFVGYQFVISKRVVLDFTVGGGIRYSDIRHSLENTDNYFRDYHDVFDIGYLGVKPKINLQIGITL